MKPSSLLTFGGPVGGISGAQIAVSLRYSQTGARLQRSARLPVFLPAWSAMPIPDAVNPAQRGSGTGEGGCKEQGNRWLAATLSALGCVIHNLLALDAVPVLFRWLRLKRKAVATQKTSEAAHTRDRRMMMTAGVTHELRTPLTILKGRLHGIEDGVINPDVGETSRLLRQVEHVLAIVNDLDTLAQYELGRITMNRRSVDLCEIVGGVVADLKPLLARHDVTIFEDYAPVVLYADPVRLTQIVTNLVTNAAKHSVAGGQVLVRIAVQRGDVVISVLDEGPGFVPEDKESLFAPFWQSEATIRRPGCSGTGMGLALSARLVEAHGGRITAENRGDGPGARFDVMFPVS